MNKIYRLIWDRTAQAWVVASEITRSRGKRRAGAALALSLIAAPAVALDGNALPGGGVVGAGSATLATNGATLTVTQQSQNATINWQNFNIGANAAVNFVQPNSSAIALNRVVGSDGTQILGRMNANGQVWVLNPNGVLFGSGAQVNVGGLVASTLGMSDADFMAGKRTFSGNGGSVVNQGTINAGSVALLGGRVSNEGVIVARLGTAALGAGKQVTLDFAGDQLLGMQVDQGALQALAANKGLIQADGGTVLMSAKAKDALLDTVVNNTGIIQARTLENRAGRIVLLGDADGGTVHVGGTLDAGAPDGGNGGFIETSGAHVQVADSATVTTKAKSGKSGAYLIDPNDFTIAASGGDMTGAQIGNMLENNGGVTIATATMGTTGGNGDINVNDTVTWSRNTLTLSAERNININAQMNAGGTAGLALEYGQGAVAAGNTSTYNVRAPVNLASTGSFSTRQGSDGATVDYTIITALGGQGSATGTDLQGIQGNLAGRYVLGADIDAGTTAGWSGGAGFNPLGKSSPFTGVFDGLGHVINDLTINWSHSDYVGLFGHTKASALRNVGLVGARVTGNANVGGLVGYQESGSIANVYVDGSITGNTNVGGLVGSFGGSITDAYTTGSVTGAAVTAGGLVQKSLGIGGLVGIAQGSIANVYSTSSVTGDQQVGGLIGTSMGSLTNTYATGKVSGGTSVGGLVGRSYGSITASFWDQTTTGRSNGVGEVIMGNPSGAIGIASLADAFSENTYTAQGWNFGTTWFMADGATRPFLRSEWSTTITNDHQLQLMAMDLGAHYRLAANLDLAATLANPSSMWKAAADDSTRSGFSPIGTDLASFTGTFDGLGHTLSNLTIVSPLANVGLFGALGSSAVVRDVGLDGGSVTGTGEAYDVPYNTYIGSLAGTNAGSISGVHTNIAVTDGSDTQPSVIGGLVGWNLGGSIANAHATGAVSGATAGGLVGENDGGGSITDAYATGKVSSTGDAGGLVGWNGGNVDADSGSITNAYATGNVTSKSSSGWINVGGLVGYNWATGTITNAYATGNVQGSGDPVTTIGGLVGHNEGGSITNAYASGTATGLSSYAEVGGLVGWNDYDGHITNAYATGAVTGSKSNAYTGGLVGMNGGNVTNTYATGAITATGKNTGGLVGYNDGDITASFWDMTRTGKTTAIGSNDGGTVNATGLTTAQLQDTAGFMARAGSWDFTGAWAPSSLGYDPVLYALTPVVWVNNISSASTYGDTTATVGAVGPVHGGAGAYVFGHAGDSVTPAAGWTLGVNGALGAGSHNVAFDGVNGAATSSDGVNYRVLYYGTNEISVGQRALTIKASNQSKTYGDTLNLGTTAFTANGLVNGDSVDSADLASLGADASATVADGPYAITASGAQGLGLANYAITYGNGKLTIAKANATVTANSGNGTYNGQQQHITGFTATGLVNGETASVLTGLTESGGVGTNAGSYAHTVSGSASNYNLIFIDGGLTIAKANATVTANSGNGTYNGQQQHITGFTATGLVNGETASVLTGLTESGGIGTNAGSYAHTISGNNGNYALTFVDGVLDIAKAALTISTGNVAKTYDGTTTALAAHGAAALVTGGTLYGGDSISGGRFAFTDKNAGTSKTVTVADVTVNDGNGGGNYDVTYTANTSSTIHKANATVTANSGSTTYNGQPQRVTGFTTAGLVNGETASVLTGLSETGGVGTDVGSYAHSFSGSDGNYNLAFVDGSLTISPSRNPADYVAANVSAQTFDGKPRQIQPTDDTGATALLLNRDQPECQMNLPANLMDACK
ncbi:GLUG motif-containing protein [Castellaniella hirudinis]|uniref:GLUG motif-containing protein n=1 Tax=Castellaniella hirudinis TaxID=1144617 RepID=A0ABV8S2Z3_9BURK